MDITTLGRSARVVRLALLGVGVALGWMLMSIVLGLSSSSALADDTEEGGGALGAVGSVVSGGATVVDDGAEAVTDTAGVVVEPVAEAAGPTVDAVPAPAVVQPVTQVVTGGAGAVAGAVEDVAENRPVSEVVEVVTTVVEHTPVVGAVAEEIGLPDAVETVGGAVDDTVGGVSDSVSDTADSVDPATDAEPVGPDGDAVLPPSTSTGDESTPTHAGGPLGAVAGSSDPMDARRDISVAAERGLRALTDAGPILFSSPTVLAASASADPVGTAWGGSSGSISGYLPVDAAVSGPGGAGLGAWGLLAFGPLFAHRAWVRSRGLDDDRLPGAPVFATDVSPD